VHAVAGSEGDDRLLIQDVRRRPPPTEE